MLVPELIWASAGYAISTMRTNMFGQAQRTPLKGLRFETLEASERVCCPIMMSTPPRMVIQENMARIASFYRASATAPRGNRSDFFNNHRR